MQCRLCSSRTVCHMLHTRAYVQCVIDVLACVHVQGKASAQQSVNQQSHCSMLPVRLTSPASQACCSCVALCALQPVQLHGSLGREAATGRGTVFATRELLKHSHAGTIASKTFVIQVCTIRPPCVCACHAHPLLRWRWGLCFHKT